MGLLKQWWCNVKFNLAYWAVKRVYKEFECGLDSVNQDFIDKMTVRNFGGLHEELHMVTMLCNVFNIDYEGLQRMSEGLPYDDEVNVDKDNDLLWQVDKRHKETDLINRVLPFDEINYITIYEHAIEFFGFEDGEYETSVDGITMYQPIKETEDHMFKPQTFKVEVRKVDGIYHIKDRHDLTPVRKIYDVPNIKKTKA